MKAGEKQLERKLTNIIKQKGGLCIKLPAIHFAGIPDRMVLLPGGIMYFVELKSEGAKPRKLQLVVHKKLRELGFIVHVIDTFEQLELL